MLLTTLGWFKQEMCKTTDSHNGLDLGVDLGCFLGVDYCSKIFELGHFVNVFETFFFTKL